LGAANPRRVQAVPWSAAHNERHQNMKLAEYLLTLHDGISEVFILEERTGDHIVIDEAVRKGVTLFADKVDRTRRFTSLTPLIIIGSAGQMGGEAGGPKLTGILYDKAGAIIAPLNGKKVLAISTSTESFYEVMHAVDKALPDILQEEKLAGGDTWESAAVKSAPEAEDVARNFLAGKLPYAIVLIHEISCRRTNQLWDVKGSYRLPDWKYLKQFRLEIDAQSGNIMGFEL
jgi:hypothetical protein